MRFIKRNCEEEKITKSLLFFRKMELPDIPFNKAEYIETASGNRYIYIFIVSLKGVFAKIEMDLFFRINQARSGGLA